MAEKQQEPWTELEQIHSSLSDEDRRLLREELLADYAAGGAEYVDPEPNVWLVDWPAAR